MMELLLKFGLSVFELYLNFRFFHCFLKVKEKIQFKNICIKIGILAFVGTTLNSLFLMSNLNIVVSITVVLIVLQLFDGKRSYGFFIAMIYTIFSIILEAIIAFAVELMFGSKRIVIETENMILFLALIIMYMFKYIMIFYLGLLRRNVLHVGGMEIYLRQAVVPTLSTIFICFFLNNQFEKGEIDYQLCYVLVLVFAIINITIYTIYENSEKLYINNYHNIKLNESLKYRENYYQDIEKHQSEIRKIRHNLKNQLLAIDGELESNQIELVKSEIKEIIRDITRTEERDFTRNISVNAVLKAKYGEALEKEIHCTFMIHVPKKLKLSGGDVGILLGNTLDNAIEASMQCERKNRKIWLDMSYFGNCLTISIKNTTEKMENHKDNKNHEHGWGLISVEEIVKRYQGELTVLKKDGIFTVSMMLWNV